LASFGLASLNANQNLDKYQFFDILAQFLTKDCPTGQCFFGEKFELQPKGQLIGLDVPELERNLDKKVVIK
jgi:hypothetical protein